jgi:hypothetical protein
MIQERDPNERTTTEILSGIQSPGGIGYVDRAKECLTGEPGIWDQGLGVIAVEAGICRTLTDGV